MSFNFCMDSAVLRFSLWLKVVYVCFVSKKLVGFPQSNVWMFNLEGAIPHQTKNSKNISVLGSISRLLGQLCLTLCFLGGAPPQKKKKQLFFGFFGGSPFLRLISCQLSCVFGTKKRAQSC